MLSGVVFVVLHLFHAKCLIPLFLLLFYFLFGDHFPLLCLAELRCYLAEQVVLLVSF